MRLEWIRSMESSVAKRPLAGLPDAGREPAASSEINKSTASSPSLRPLYRPLA